MFKHRSQVPSRVLEAWSGQAHHWGLIQSISYKSPIQAIDLARSMLYPLLALPVSRRTPLSLSAQHPYFLNSLMLLWVLCPVAIHFYSVLVAKTTQSPRTHLNAFSPDKKANSPRTGRTPKSPVQGFRQPSQLSCCFLLVCRHCRMLGETSRSLAPTVLRGDSKQVSKFSCIPWGMGSRVEPHLLFQKASARPPACNLIPGRFSLVPF